MLACLVTACHERLPAQLQRHATLEQVVQSCGLQRESMPMQEQSALETRAGSFRAKLRRERRKHSWNSIPLSFFVDGDVLEARGPNGRCMLVPTPSRELVVPAPAPAPAPVPALAAAEQSAGQEQRARQQGAQLPQQSVLDVEEQRNDVRCNAWSLIVSLLTFGVCAI